MEILQTPSPIVAKPELTVNKFLENRPDWGQYALEINEKNCREQFIQFLEILGRGNDRNILIRFLNAKDVPSDVMLANNLGFIPKGKTNVLPLTRHVSFDCVEQKATYLKCLKDAEGNILQDEKKRNIRVAAKIFEGTRSFYALVDRNDHQGAYLVVNPGGNFNDEIEECVALFYECDDVSKEEQWERLADLENALGKPASLVVGTAKSLHVYFVLKTPLKDSEEWIKLQQRLIQRQKSDKAIHNPARLMRLPGLDHIKWFKEDERFLRTPVRLVQATSAKFSVKEFDRVLPPWNPLEWHSENKRVRALGEIQSLDYSEFEIDSSDNPWSLKNFVQLGLPGLHERNTGFLKARCPVHNGEADNSFWMNKNSGAFGCYAGCSTKLIYATILEQAKLNGYKLPSAETRQRSPEEIEAWKQKRQAEIEQTQAYLNRMDLPPTLESSEEAMPIGTLPPSGGVAMGDGPMGSQKTRRYIKGMVEEFLKRHPDGKVRLLGNTNGLMYQTVKALGGVHHEGHPNPKTERIVAGCWNSFEKFIDLASESPLLLILDEAEANLAYLVLGETMKGRHERALDKAYELFKLMRRDNCYTVFAEDGLTNVLVDFIHAFMGKNTPIEFTKKVTQRKVRRHIQCFSSPNKSIEQIWAKLQQGENVILASDSKDFAHKLQTTLLQQNVLKPEEILVVSAATVEFDDRAKTFLGDPNGWLKANPQIRLLAYTPSLQSGVSIEVPHFHSLCFHLVGLEPRLAKQLPERYRPECYWFGHVSEKGSSDESGSSYLPREIIANQMNTLGEQAKGLNFFAYAMTRKDELDEAAQSDVDVEGQALAMLKAKDPRKALWLEFYAKIQARSAYGRAHLREQLEAIWLEKGYEVSYDGSRASKDVREAVAFAKETLKAEEARDIAEADADYYSIQEARDILQEIPANLLRAQWFCARKAVLREQYPGFNLDQEENVRSLIVDGKGSKYLLDWQMKNLEQVKKLTNAAWFKRFAAALKDESFVWLPSLKKDHIRASLLAKAPIAACLVNEPLTNENEAIITLHAWALKNKSQLYKLFRLTIKADHTPIQTAGKLIRKLGYAWELVERRGDDRNSVYRILDLEDPLRAEAHQAFDLYFSIQDLLNDPRSDIRLYQKHLAPETRSAGFELNWMIGMEGNTQNLDIDEIVLAAASYSEFLKAAKLIATLEEDKFEEVKGKLQAKTWGVVETILESLAAPLREEIQIEIDNAQLAAVEEGTETFEFALENLKAIISSISDAYGKPFNRIIWKQLPKLYRGFLQEHAIG